MSSAQINSSCLQHAGSTSTYIVLTNCTVSGSDCSHSKADCNCLVTSCFPTTTTFFSFFFCSIAIVQICVCILRWTLYREVLKHYKCASIKSFKIPIARYWTQMMLYMLWMLIGWQMDQSREETDSRNHQERKKFKKNQRLKRYQQGLLWTLCIIFNTLFHFSSLCVITLLSTQPPGKSNNEMSSSTQTSFTTYFMHSIHPQMFSPLISMDSQHATTSEPQFHH